MPLDTLRRLHQARYNYYRKVERMTTVKRLRLRMMMYRTTGALRNKRTQHLRFG